MEKGEKRGQRRGAAKGKCPPVRETQEGPAGGMGEKGVKERGWPKEKAGGEGKPQRSLG